MNVPGRSELIVAGLVAAGLAIGFVPSRGQTQDSNLDPAAADQGTAVIRFKFDDASDDPNVAETPAIPAVPRTTVNVKPPTAPAAPPAPAAPRVKTHVNVRTVPGAGRLADQIREIQTEVEKSVARDFNSNPGQKSNEIRDRLNRQVTEKLTEKLRSLELHTKKAEAERQQLEAERTRLEAHFQRDSADVLQPNLKIRVFESRTERDGRNRGNPDSDQQFERLTRSLLSTYGSYTDANRNEFLEKLTKVVSEHFDFKQTARERELKQLEEQLATLRGLHNQRLKERKEIIQDRVRQLTRDAAGLGWGNTRAEIELDTTQHPGIFPDQDMLEEPVEVEEPAEVEELTE